MEDRFNEGMSCINQFVIPHAILRRSQIILTFSRPQIMYNVSCVLPCVEIACKGTQALDL